MNEQWLLLFERNTYAGNTEMKRSLFKSFHDILYKDIYHLLKDHGLTEDVIQESFIKIFLHYKEMPNISNIRAWIKKIARNTAYDLLRKNQKYIHRLESDSLDFEMNMLHMHSEQSVAEVVETAIRNKTLHSAILELKYEYRIVLLMFHRDKLSYKDIANKLSITEEVLTQRLVRARRKLAEVFKEMWLGGNEVY
ncbi:MAG: hypothetical protein K0Q73_8659 [Paenibacillus sp.]|nr:hypothetical protein [Paenibacillus sp.]